MARFQAYVRKQIVLLTPPTAMTDVAKIFKQQLKIPKTHNVQQYSIHNIVYSHNYNVYYYLYKTHYTVYNTMAYDMRHTRRHHALSFDMQFHEFGE